MTDKGSLDYSLAEARGFRDALQHILDVLGTGNCTIPACDGCEWERGEAVETARVALERGPEPKAEAERYEVVGREPYEEVVRVVEEPRAGAVGEGHKPEQVGLSREEIEAAVGWLDEAELTSFSGAWDEAADSARAKLRAWLEDR